MIDAEDDFTPKLLERVSTGIAGLDTITGGGFFRGGIYMVLARPGSGKSILANQVSFRHVAGGGRAIYVTLLAETHARMISAIRSLSFFDSAAVGASLTYLSGYDALEKGKLKGLLDVLRKTIRDHKATLLVIDGLVTVGAVAESEMETKRFIHELQVFVELIGCTTLLLTGANPDDQYALRTMVDGLLELHLDSVGMEGVRGIEITKFRGSAVLLGKHLFEINDAGVVISPRTESRRGRSAAHTESAPASLAPFGIRGLDPMLGGGLRSDSMSMVLGAPGSGKTLLGLSFLAGGARAGERGLYFGFFEPGGVLCRKADAIGLDLTEHVRSGLVDVEVQPSRGVFADTLAERVLGAVRERGIRRLFIDGLDGFKDSLVYPDRTRPFFGALCDELRSMGVLTLLSDQTQSLSGIELPERGLTAMLDNVIALRHVERGAELRKLISVVKMREGAGDSSLRAFSIDRRGFVVSPVPDAAEVPATRAPPARRAAPSRSAPPRRPTAKKVGKKRGR